MFQTRIKRFVAACAFLVAFIGITPSHADDRLNEMAVDAYVYAYPMVLMEITRQVATNVEAPEGKYAPMNRWAHLREFPDHTFKEVVRPNADTLYSILYFDVSGEPLVLSVGDSKGRYYMLPILDMWTDVVAVPGSRTSGNGAQNFALVGPEWNGKLPKGVEPIRSTTNQGWIIGRTNTEGKADYAAVHAFQDSMKVVPLSEWGSAKYAPPAKVAVEAGVDRKTPPPVQVAKMDAKTFFGLFAEVMKKNPPHETDWNMLEYLKAFHIVPGKHFDFASLDAEHRTALTRAVSEGQKAIKAKANNISGQSVNGWGIAREFMGNYGNAYLQRAYIALIGLGANPAEDAVYPMSVVDADGTPYSGKYAYVLHFKKDELPPVRGFWSLTMYDESYFADNPIGRYAIGDRDALKYNNDGSLDLYISHASPGKEKESNWLPSPAGKFDLTLRLYWPKAEVLNGAWNPPAVHKVK
jgi:hypothetical protein